MKGRTTCEKTKPYIMCIKMKENMKCYNERRGRTAFDETKGTENIYNKEKNDKTLYNVYKDMREEQRCHKTLRI